MLVKTEDLQTPGMGPGPVSPDYGNPTRTDAAVDLAGSIIDAAGGSTPFEDILKDPSHGLKACKDVSEPCPASENGGDDGGGNRPKSKREDRTGSRPSYRPRGVPNYIPF